MSKDEFLAELRIHLHGLQREEINQVVADYEQYFDIKLKEGMAEREIVRQLRDPKVIASEIKGGHVKSNHKDGDGVRQILIGIGLVFFNLVFILGPVLGVIGLIFGLFVAAISFVFSPIAIVFKLLLGSGHVFEFFISLVLAGIGLLLFPLLIRGTGFFFKMLEKYANWNMKLLRGES